ncbi:Rv1733c family protein [Prauserella alba]|uniref:Membrane protein n=1 Tax=Prauserella alba TaxID=176898 RepID=A0ABN1VCJ3_9PSEU|nr:hypothetical protein [Prauserella alba]MCP2182220.1 hypothetical protein [Prauserella alba]
MEPEQRVVRQRRFFRRLWPGRNPLARSWDRVEGVVLLLAILAPLVMLPFAAAAGSETYARDQRASAVQARGLYRAEATLLADAPSLTPLPARAGTSADEVAVRAEWRLADGSRKVGTVRAEAGSLSGSTVPVWLDQRGDPTQRPQPSAHAMASAIGAATALWLGTVTVCVGGYWLVRKLLDRRRFDQWEREWTDIGPRSRY